MEPIPATTPLAVVLEAQQWNNVIAALGKAPYEVVAPLIQTINEQLQRGAAQLQLHQPANGLDAHAELRQ